MKKYFIKWKMKYLKNRPRFKTWTVYGNGLGISEKSSSILENWENMENNKEMTITHSITSCTNKYAHTTLPKS